MEKQLGFLVDTQKCIGCRTCEFACKNERNRKDTSRRKVVSLSQNDGNIFGYLSIACNHCQNPACLSVCPTACIKKTRNGIVLLDSSNCSGCKLCVNACPFHAITIIPDTGKADKCDFCMERQRSGELPACVSSCIVGAIQVIDINSEQNSGHQKAIVSYQMKSITCPSIRFKEKKVQSQRFWAQDERE
ncbi:4Fe-4S dicluster domain-containing protein [Brevibacillus sp. SYSU BS000544]|uniref:4Fe-4S dicluster domain-containing protein n=1 Tax=Brevibacillus sp. SYSU BS000544 TaxID=3416443 RepID=UPI003CE44F15